MSDARPFVVCWQGHKNLNASFCSVATQTPTMAEQTFGLYIIGFDSSSSRCGPAVYLRWPNPRSLGSRTKSFHTCQGLGPRRVGQVLAMTPPSILPSVLSTTSAPRIFKLSRASRPAESHRRPLSEPSVKLSPHWAPIRRTSRSYRVSSVRRSPGTPQPAASEKAWP